VATTPAATPATPTAPAEGGWRFGHLTRNAPVSTIMTSIVLVLVTVLLLALLYRTTRIITLIFVAAFFAVVLTPPVDFLVKRMRLRRALATSIVFLLGIAALIGLGVLFIKPLAEQGTEFANDLPTYVRDAKAGKGPVGDIIKRYKIDDWVEKNADELQRRVQDIFEPKKVFGIAVATAGTVFSTVATILTVGVLIFLMLLQGRNFLLSTTRLMNQGAQQRLLHVGRQCSRAITGYVNGNLLISVIAGITTWIFLLIVNVPFAAVLALWVAVADLIPLVGATLGAIPTIAVAFLHSVPAGIATIIFYVAYQQIENNLLQPTVMSRTVAMQPLSILISVLIGVELFGLLGALLAIPVAGIIKVVAVDIIHHRRPDLFVHEPAPKHHRKVRKPKRA
jgi:predicted PurR-regulated permease PerM